jgi:hypothetical protein
MDYIFFIPPFPFFEGTCADFADPTLIDCWYGRVVLLCRIQVKLDITDDDGRSVQMDCDCAMIECLYDFAPGRCACAIICFSVHVVCIGYALFAHKCAMSVHINQSLLLQCTGESPPGGRRPA